MNEETPEIIEVEAVDAAPDSGNRKVAPEPLEKPKKAPNDHSKAIDRLSRILLVFARLVFPLFFFGVPMGLAFAILFQQSGGNVFFLVMMILGFALLAAGIVLYLLGFPLRAMLRKYMKEDPNYQER